MSWTVTATNKGGDFEKAPAGNHAAALVGLIDLGTQYDEYQGRGRWDRRVLWVWELIGVRNKAGKNHCVGCDLTFSLGKKSRMRKIIQGRIGRELRDEEEYDITQELGKPCLVSVVVKGEHTNFDNVSACPSGFALPPPTYPITNIMLAEYLGKAKAIPDWVPFIYGETPQQVIANSKEVAGDRGARGGVPQGQRNGEYPADKPDSDDIPF